MIIVLQILFALLLILLIILFVFRPKRIEAVAWPQDYQVILQDYVRFYANLDEEGKKVFEDKFQKFLLAVKITGANAQVEDLDIVLVGAAAVIPVYYIRDWEYINLKEVLLYPGNFNFDFEQQGYDRTVSGMVGSGALQNVLIISKWELRQGFINSMSNNNTAIHEFVHLIDKMDGTLDGVPEILLERKYVPKWQQLLQLTMDRIRRGESDINPYGATSAVECFAVISEYFFENPDLFGYNHPELNEMMKRIFIRI
ncbi:zinc-dependent peptidase [Chitinophagaceae bacterium LB-8]|uniref:Zinc-dependent peptidase n=1 Tax=Paraflavisolibacter caeni TaxID=2982496 RepID=A0A9X2XNZ8_9BACT|nr:zinc-dependent peptidase [Paraflavisolibacter caeni]MCU7550063.1 zinc-dependent peptidase [Paraflavisolibacter caeni]